MRYFLGLGSNMAPHVHMPAMLRALFEFSPTIYVGRVLETTPVGVEGEPFLNLPVCFSSRLSPPALKEQLNRLEAAFGRDRSDPASKQKSRTADFDILFWLEAGAAFVVPALLPDEPYMRPMLLELLSYLNLQTVAERPMLPAGVALPLDDLTFGHAPLTLTLRGSRVTT